MPNTRVSSAAPAPELLRQKTIGASYGDAFLAATASLAIAEEIVGRIAMN
jgi:hypothetical protein